VASTEDDVVVRLRLKDVKQFIADVKSGKLAIDDLEKKIQKTGRTAASASAPSGGLGKLASHFGMLAGFARTGTLALGAATVGVAGYAVKSAASLEQVSMSFETLLHSAGAARTMVASLQKFAAQTPFEMPDVERGAQKLLAFGFAAKSVIPSMTAVGNAVSGLNLGPEGFDRVITALGQIRMKGRVQGDEMLQLAEAGINANAYLERAFHLTPAQLQKAQQAGKISAAAAIPVILKGMDDQFKGLMAKQSHTLGGIWSNFHDAMEQGLVRLVNPFLPTMEKWLQSATDYLGGKNGGKGFMDRLGQFMAVLPGNITSGRSGFAAYNIGAILGNHKFDPAIEKGVRVVHNLGVIVKDVLVPALKDFSAILAPVVLVLEHLDSITGFVADHSTAFRRILEGVALGVIAYKLALLGVNAALKAQAFWNGIAELSTTKFTKATNAQKVALLIYKGVMLAVTAATRAWAAAQWLLDAALVANPVGLIVAAIAAAIVAIGVGLYLAYTKIKPFRDFINGLWADMKGFQKWITEVWNPTQWSSHSEATGQTIAPSLVGGATGVAAQSGGTVAHPGPLISLMGHASGGIMTQRHTAWVGERGPELVTLPRGSAVIPLPRVPEFAGGRHIEIPVVLNGREIARAVYDDMDDRMARR
jgi:tape measure domain-containing protein